MLLLNSVILHLQPQQSRKCPSEERCGCRKPIPRAPQLQVAEATLEEASHTTIKTSTSNSMEIKSMAQATSQTKIPLKRHNSFARRMVLLNLDPAIGVASLATGLTSVPMQVQVAQKVGDNIVLVVANTAVGEEANTVEVEVKIKGVVEASMGVVVVNTEVKGPLVREGDNTEGQEAEQAAGQVVGTAKSVSIANRLDTGQTSVPNPENSKEKAWVAVAVATKG